MASTIRVSSRGQLIIEDIVKMTKKQKVEILEEALEDYRFRERMRILSEDFDRLRSNEEAWQQELEERRELDGTIGDGLEDE